MPMSPLYCNDLTLSPEAKVIPYAGDRTATEASTINYGFRNLKIKPSLIDTIPELTEDESLKALVRSLNDKDTCFFTVGCFSKQVEDSERYRQQGYLEFSWNCAGCVQDAINYFALYFHFEKFLRGKGFNQPVHFKWIIQEAAFSDVSVDGFSCAIYIETRLLSSVEQAHQVWQLSLRMIDAYLNTVHTLMAKPIYTPLPERSG